MSFLFLPLVYNLFFNTPSTIQFGFSDTNCCTASNILSSDNTGKADFCSNINLLAISAKVSFSLAVLISGLKTSSAMILCSNSISLAAKSSYISFPPI